MIKIIFLFLVFFLQQNCAAEETWQPLNAGIKDVDIHSISVFSGDDNLICAASRKCLYFSENGGDFWREVLSFKGEPAEINFVTFDSLTFKTLFVATTRGLFVVENQGRLWQRIFKRVSEEANNVRWIALDFLDCRKIYIGTQEGLYFSRDKAITWSRLKGGLPRAPVNSIAIHPRNSYVLYLANTYGLFKSTDSGRTWQRIYVTSVKIGDEEDEEELSQTSENQNLINCIAIDRDDPRRVFIATGRGVFISSDAGESWNKLSSRGLSCDYVNFIIVPDKKDAIYAATENGVFEFCFDLNSWHEIYRGMTARNVRCLALSMDEKRLFAGTDKGIFKTIDLKNVQTQKVNREIDFERMLKQIRLNEPTIREVQEAALRYGEVIHPESIRNLRRGAKLKALLPDVSVDYDKTIYAGSTGKKDAFVGPRDWGLTLSWDVGDLVFSEQLRLIDSNTRLAVQLRSDILDEVTRLYYERRKLQTEFILFPPKKPKDKLTRLLRLEELTANIDALTGGYFSRQLKK